MKLLSLDNWLEPDDTHRAFSDLNTASGDRWARMILSYELDEETVPEEVHDLWRIAQGVLLYGWFYYPIYGLGDEQLHRVVDAAVDHAFRRFGGPLHDGESPPFQSRLEWLIARRYIDPRWTPRWMAIKELRNMGSHGTRASIALPHEPIRSLKLFRDEINGLFSSDEPRFLEEPAWSSADDENVRRKAAKRVRVGDRYALAGQLQGALTHLTRSRDSRLSDGDAAIEAESARLLIENVRDRLLGLESEPIG